MIKKLNDVRAKIESIVKNPVQRGHTTGFKCLDEFYTVKKGSFTIWLGSPGHGKSEIIFEVLFAHAMEGEISLVYSPETGTAEEIMLELAHKYLMKQIVRHNPLNAVASELDMWTALEWVDYHFAIVDDEEKGYSWDELLVVCEEYEKEHRCRITQIMAEPYNELVHDMKEHGGRQDLYIEAWLTGVRRCCRAKKKHAHLSFHTGQQHLEVIDKIKFYPMPKAREAAGGQAALRKAMGWINIWRPKAGLKDANGQPYAPNEVLIQVEKAKPKYVMYTGTCSLYFDTVKNRYYEKIHGLDLLMGEHITRRAEIEQAMPATFSQGAMEFEPPVEVEDEMPF